MENVFTTPAEMLAVKSTGKYPWRTVKVGESFKVPYTNMSHTNVLNYSYRMGKKLGKSFKVKDYPEYQCSLVALVGERTAVVKEDKPIDKPAEKSKTIFEVIEKKKNNDWSIDTESTNK